MIEVAARGSIPSRPTFEWGIWNAEFGMNPENLHLADGLELTWAS